MCNTSLQAIQLHQKVFSEIMQNDGHPSQKLQWHVNYGALGNQFTNLVVGIKLQSSASSSKQGDRRQACDLVRKLLQVAFPSHDQKLQQVVSPSHDQQISSAKWVWEMKSAVVMGHSASLSLFSHMRRHYPIWFKSKVLHPA